ncbi:MAG TPA: contractile injection system protein, VgrG/Pvc8 family, partial [Planctomycetota bacterium]|nr:contractile injection system protein, VgrG/Pvc8 family [Planctomycetota bacterium]
MAKVMNITLEGFEDPGFEVISFRGAESISTPFRYVLTLGSSSPSQDFDGLLEAKAHLELGDPAVHIRGVLSSIQQGYDGAWEPTAGTLTRFEVVLVPDLWKLSLTTRTKIFQEMSVPDIVKKVLDEAGLPGGETEWKLSGTHEKKEFVLQYQESDL